MDKNAPHDQPLGRLQRFGDAAHGLYRYLDGQILTPGLVSIPVPGIAPDASDCHLIRPPGTRPDTRTPEEVSADTAAGRTWLDYGIISGLNHRLYGKSLNVPGSPGWIYIAPDGSRWLARMVFANDTTLRLTFRRFGTISRSSADTSIVQTVDVPIAGLKANGEYVGISTVPTTDAKLYRFDAMSSTGAKVLITGRQRIWALGGVDGPNTPHLGISTATNGANNAAGPAGGAWEVVISGTPPAASATCTLLIQPRSAITPDVQIPFAAWEVQRTPASGGDEVTLVYKANLLTALGQSPAQKFTAEYPAVTSKVITRPIGTHTYTHNERWLAGGYYDEDDNLELVTALMSYTCNVTFALTPAPEVHPSGSDLYGGSGSYSVSVSGSVVFSCHPGSPIPFSASAGFSFSFAEASLGVTNYDALPTGKTTATAASSSATIGSPGWTVTGAAIKTTFSSGYTRIAQAVSGLTFGEYGWLDEFKTMWPLRFHVIRFANRCWGMIAEARTDGSQAGQAVVAAYVSPEEIVVDMVDVLAANGIGYATAHPVTGTIAYSTTTNVCWV